MLGQLPHCTLPTSRGGLGNNLCLPEADWEEHRLQCLLLGESSTFLGAFTRCRRSLIYQYNRDDGDIRPPSSGVWGPRGTGRVLVKAEHSLPWGVGDIKTSCPCPPLIFMSFLLAQMPARLSWRALPRPPAAGGAPAQCVRPHHSPGCRCCRPLLPVSPHHRSPADAQVSGMGLGSQICVPGKIVSKRRVAGASPCPEHPFAWPRRCHKRGGYDVENEEKIKLGITVNH